MVKKALWNSIRFLKALLVLILTGSQVFAQTANLEFFRLQQDYFKGQRTLSEKANPFQNPNQFKDSDEVNSFLSRVSNERYFYKYDKEKNEVSVFDKNQGNQMVSVIPLSTREEVLKYSPSKFKNKLAEISKAAYRSGAEGIKHTALNLPMEVSIFYMAIGSVSAFYLFSNAGQNPAALKLFNDQQTSAVGMTSLFMFLASQNATSSIAQLAIKNPKWHLMIPYLSMTVGTMAQNYTTSMLTDPNIKACLNEWFGSVAKVEGANENPCDKAYEYFTLQKPWEFASGLTSMIVSTAIASSIQYGISSAALAVEKKVTEQVIKNELRREIVKASLLRFAGFVNPGAVPYLAMTGVWMYLTKASNLAFFAALDHQITNQVTFAVKNLQESVSLPFVNSLQKSSDILSSQILNQKKNNWAIERNQQACRTYRNGDCSGFVEELAKFQEQMKMWRMANISDVVETHQSWQTYLGDLVARYSASKDFYSRFVSEALKYKSNPHREENFLDRQYPLFGIKTTKTKYLDETFVTDPHLPESEQVDLALKFKDEMLGFLEKIKARTHGLNGEYLDLANALEKLFRNNTGSTMAEKVKLGQAILEVNKWLNDQYNRGRYQYENFKEVLAIYRRLDRPEPKLIPGEGYIASLNRSPVLNEMYKAIDLSRDNKMTMSRPYQNYGQVMLRNMICGPDSANAEALIDSTWGFQSHFTSPSITDFKNQVKGADNVCDTRFGGQFFRGLLGNSFVAPLSIDPKQRMATYSTVFEYLKFNLKKEIYQDGFDAWWKRNTETPMTAAFNDFQSKYDQNIVKLVRKLWQTENSAWNRSGTVANGILINAVQELRVYLTVLGEILKDHARLQNVPLSGLTVSGESQKQAYAALLQSLGGTQNPEIVKYQARGSYLDFEFLQNQLNPGLGGKASNQITLFAFQANLEKTFAEINGLLRKIRLSEVDGRTVVSGDLDNSDFDKMIDQVEKISLNVAKLLGVSKEGGSQEASAEIPGFPVLGKSTEAKSSKAGPQQVVELNDSTKQVAVKCLEYIQGLSYELKSYGMIINAVSWKNLNNLKKFSEESSKQQEKVDQILNSLKANKKVGG